MICYVKVANETNEIIQYRWGIIIIYVINITLDDESLRGLMASFEHYCVGSNS